jgi:ribosomal-protein-alanine N-acetyltransferase
MQSDPFKVFPMLTAGDLVLREITSSDIPDMMELSYYNGVQASSEKEIAVMLERIANDYRNGQALHWGITLEGNDTIVGSCGFYRGFSGGIGEVGYMLRQAYQGKGIMTKAVNELVRFGFDVLKLQAVKAYTRPVNQPSINVLKRAGFEQVESDLPEYIKFLLNKNN